MARPRHLARAPITEAIVDFRVKARPGFDPTVFGTLKESLAGRFPQVAEQRTLQAVLHVGARTGPAPEMKDVGLHGLLFKSADGLDIAQFRVDGFTFNRLKPYTSWTQIFPLAMQLWNSYTSVAGPEMVTRLALRYLNRISLPSTLADFAQVMVAPPPVPEALPQSVSGFLTRVTIHDVDADIAAHVSQALEQGGPDAGSSLILDIDAYRMQDIDVHSEQVAPTFEALRDFKNRVFFESVTEQTLKEFE